MAPALPSLRAVPFQESGQLPALVTITFSAFDQDDADHDDQARFVAKLSGTPSLEQVWAVVETNSRDAGFYAERSLSQRQESIAGYIVRAAFAHLPWQVKLLLILGVVAALALSWAVHAGLPPAAAVIGIAVVAVTILVAYLVNGSRRQEVAEPFPTTFEMAISPVQLEVRCGGVVVRTVKLDEVEAIERWNAYRLALACTNGKRVTLPMAFAASDGRSAVARRLDALLIEAKRHARGGAYR
jgi:hypothetical protein